jgi:hypothetical protein
MYLLCRTHGTQGCRWNLFENAEPHGSPYGTNGYSGICCPHDATKQVWRFVHNWAISMSQGNTTFSRSLTYWLPELQFVQSTHGSIEVRHVWHASAHNTDHAFTTAPLWSRVMRCVLISQGGHGDKPTFPIGRTRRCVLWRPVIG